MNKIHNLAAGLFALSLMSVSCGSTTGVGGLCTFVSPTSGTSAATLCYTYPTTMPTSAATGGSGICPSGSSTATVTTVTSCPTTLGTQSAAQLGTCTVAVPALGSIAAYSYTILYYAGSDYTTCSSAHTGCTNQTSLGSGYAVSWAGISGCT